MAEITVERQVGILDAPSQFIDFLARHWLLFANTFVGIFAGLPFLAPVLAMLGADGPARLIYFVYQFTCHQLPQRSFFLGGPQFAYSFDQIAAATGGIDFWSFYHNPLTLPALGYQVAYCQRDVAIYSTIFLAGLLFALVRSWLRPLPLWAVALFALPMAVDGFTQLFALRESTWELRLLTGSLFGLGMVWLGYPYLEWGFQDIQRSLVGVGRQNPQHPA